jgi:very-short-patch-repair endonuclease
LRGAETPPGRANPVDRQIAHRGRRAFESDRRRDTELRAAGYTVARFTDRQVVESGDWVVERLRTFLRASSSDRR